jgi:hypothetical protein
MAGLFLDYCLFMSIGGTILLLFLSFCCFIDMEAMRLPHGSHNRKGGAVLVAALVN